MYISRQFNGLFMLTVFRPKIADVKGLGHKDLYIRYGDPAGVRNLCSMVLAEYGVDKELDILESVKVRKNAGRNIDG